MGLYAVLYAITAAVFFYQTLPLYDVLLISTRKTCIYHFDNSYDETAYSHDFFGKNIVF